MGGFPISPLWVSTETEVLVSLKAVSSFSFSAAKKCLTKQEAQILAKNSNKKNNRHRSSKEFSSVESSHINVI